jgi:hypothetical protein
VPELKLSRPDTPALPAFIVRTVTDPLDVDEPYPDSTDTAPPEWPLPAPPPTSTAPPLADAVAVYDNPARMDTMPPTLSSAVD